MPLHATENLEAAFEATRDLLTPLDARRWVRLAAMVFFLGGVSMPGLSLSFEGGSLPFDPRFPGFLVRNLEPLILAVAGFGLLLALGFAVVGNVMEFVLVEALVSGETRIRGPFSEHIGDGLRLLGFRILLVLAVVLPIALLVAGAIALDSAGLFFLPLLFAIPILLLFVPLVAAVNGFTTAFVVPIMLREACGPIAGWKRLWPVVRGDVEEYGVYLVLSVVLSMVGGALVSTVVGLLAAVLLIPAGLVGLFGVGAGLLLGASELLLLLLAPFIMAGVFALLAVAAVVRVPVVAYLRYYALLELGETSEYDLLGRNDDGDDGGDGDDDGTDGTDGGPTGGADTPSGTPGSA